MFPSRLVYVQKLTDSSKNKFLLPFCSNFTKNCFHIKYKVLNFTDNLITLQVLAVKNCRQESSLNSLCVNCSKTLKQFVSRPAKLFCNLHKNLALTTT